VDLSFASAVVILLLVTDPIGNIPLFVTLLRRVERSRRVLVIGRECAIALGVLLLFGFFGRALLDLFGLSDRSLNLAGGVILFLIALRMIFRTPEGIFGESPLGEPFIVPLAIPSIVGPAAIATVVLLVSRAPQRLPEWLLAASTAIAVCFLVLIFAERISRWVGERVLAAFERLMGLLLTAIAVEMLLRGIEGFVRYLQSR
jgi:MarC family membrane protein